MSGRKKAPAGRGGLAALFGLTIASNLVYLVWRLGFTIPWDAGLGQAAAGLVLALCEASTTLGMCELMIGRLRSGAAALTPPDTLDHWPEVDVFIATHNEPPQLLYKTINACMFLDYPQKEKVHVWVCDDGDRPAVAALAKRLGAGYLGLSGNRQAKSGNYNHALAATRAPLVATFDADMIPRSSFLLKTVPYFFIPGKAVALVQTPQSFYNNDLFQFNLYLEKDIPNEQDFFSREINLLRNSANAAAYTGSNTLILREALEKIGGFPCDTVTEDFETSILLQQAGYITYATDEVLAAGLSTTTVKSMIGQRVRWARGVLQSIRNTRAVFSRRLPLAARLTYLSAWLYWWSFFNRLVFILAPILFALFDLRLVDCAFWELAAFWLPSHLLYRLAVRRLSTNVRSMRWSQIIDTIFAPYLAWPVLAETLGLRLQTFKVTSKKAAGGRTASARYLAPHGALALLTVAALARYLHGKYGLALFYSSVILYWLGYNLMTLCYAILFMLGRQVHRRHDRIRAEEPAVLRLGRTRLEGRTTDVSEAGAALWLERPPDGGAAPGARGLLEVRAGRYRARLRARVVRAEPRPDGLFLTAVVRPRTEADRRQWMQIIHDRPHSLPTELDPWLTVYDDVSRNLVLRFSGGKKRGGTG